MGIRLFRGGQEREEKTVNDIIKKIKNGDRALKEKFIGDYIPFIIKSVSQFSGKYVEIENSEEFSVALSAFNEAIECYNENINHNFFKFTSQVIKRRLINHVKKDKKKVKTYPFTYFENDESGEIREELFVQQPYDHERKIDLSDQMQSFEKRLNEFNISFKELAKNSPKHKDSKQLSIQIARIISANDELFLKMDRKKTIPMVDLMKHVQVNQKTIERNRKFIIAVCLILRGEYDVLIEFVNG